MQLRSVAVCAGLLGAGLFVAVLAQAPGGGSKGGAGSKDAAGDNKDADVLAALEKLAKAFNDKDAKAFAAIWSEDAEYIDGDGDRLVGRKAIEADYAQVLGKAGKIRLEIDVDKIRRLGTDVANVDGEARVTRPNDTVRRTSFHALLVRRNGEWFIDSVREHNLPDDDSNAEFLEELAWLNGKWHYKEGDTEILLDCAEVANGNFRTHRFQVKTRGEISHEGTHVVGYDAAKKQLRSWVFASDGSFGDGYVESKGNRWAIRASGILPDGEKSAATQ